MSLAATQWALTIRPDVVGAGAWRLLVHLSDYADPDGRHVFPHTERLAREVYKSERTVQRYLRELVEAKLIYAVARDQRLVEHIRGDRRPTVWRLALNGIEDVGDDDALVRGASSVTPSEPVDNHAQRHDTSVTPSPVDNSHGVTTADAHGVTTVVATKTPGITRHKNHHPRAREAGDELNSHPSHGNARRALNALPDVADHPGSLNRIVLLAYEVGNGDPWLGYMVIRASLEQGQPPTDTRDLYRLLRHRLIPAEVAS